MLDRPRHRCIRMSRWKQFLAAYDVCDDRRRSRALRVMLDYAGDRQKSVFECRVAQADVPLVMERVGNLIDLSTDRFILCRVRQMVCVSQAESVGLATGTDVHWFG